MMDKSSPNNFNNVVITSNVPPLRFNLISQQCGRSMMVHDDTNIIYRSVAEGRVGIDAIEESSDSKKSLKSAIECRT